MAEEAGDIEWLRGLCMKLANAQDIDASLDVLQETLHHFGWGRLVYGWKAADAAADGIPVPVLVRDFPENWDRHWAAHSANDPYFERVFLTREPVRWSSVKANEGELAPKQVDCIHYLEDLGIEGGLTVPISVSGRRFAFITALDFDAPDRVRSETELREEADIIKLIAHFFDNHMIGVSAEAKGLGASLSPREKECLLWSAMGKTVDDVATIVGISPETVRVYLKRVMSKMNATNKTHAVAKALHMGIVTIN